MIQYIFYKTFEKFTGVMWEEKLMFRYWEGCLMVYIFKKKGDIMDSKDW